MLSNAYFLAKFRFDTAENEPAKSLQKFAKFANFANFAPSPLNPRRRPLTWRATASSPAGRERGRRLRRALRRARRRVRERRLAKFWQNVARFRLYRLQFVQENMRFAAFFKIYQIIKLNFLKFGKFLQILRHLQNFC